MPDTKSRSAVARSIRYALLAVVLVVSASATTPPTNLPKIDIVYPSGGSLLDRLCQTYFKAPVDPMAVQAAAQRRPQFQAQWDAEGAAYMRAAFDEAGLAFPYAEAQVTLSVCSPASMSAPLLVDVKDFLPGATHPHPSWEFSEVVFHELMHVYVGRVVSSSRMMQK